MSPTTLSYNALANCLAKCGSSTLSEFIGFEALELMDKLGMNLGKSATLANLAIEFKGPDFFVLDKGAREHLLLALSKDEAEALLEALGTQNTGNPWKALQTVRFTPKNHETRILRVFLGLPATPIDDSEEELAPSSLPITACMPEYALFSHQIRAAQETWSYLSSEKPRAILHMPTGSGKTRTAMNVICRWLREREPTASKNVVLWLAHSEELCEQAAQEFERAWQHLGDREVEVYRHFGANRVELDKAKVGFFVGSLSLLYQECTNRQSTFLKFSNECVRFIILDEAHQATAPTYKHLLSTLDPHASENPMVKGGRPLLGLTATPGRSWLDAKQDLELARFFRGQKVTLSVQGFANPVAYLQARGYLAQTEYLPLQHDPEGLSLHVDEQQKLEQGWGLSARVLKELGKDNVRNLLIFDHIALEADAGRKILVFACSVAHAKLLSSLLKLKGYDAACILGSTPREERRQAIASFKQEGGVQILTNFGVLTTGFDAPIADVAVVARPTRSVVLYTQMVGRVARGPKQGGGEWCKVITIIDNIPGFRSLAEGFGHWEDIWSEDVLQQLGL